MEFQTDQEARIIDCYANCALLLQRAVQELKEDELDLAENDESWTIREYIHHMVDGDDIWKVFIKRALGNSQGAFLLDWYWQMSQMDWGREWHYAQREIEPSVALFSASRAHVAQLLHSTNGALDKHLVMGLPDGNEQLVSIREIVEMQTSHIEGHIADIHRILATHHSQVAQQE